MYSCDPGFFQLSKLLLIQQAKGHADGNADFLLDLPYRFAHLIHFRIGQALA